MPTTVACEAVYTKHRLPICCKANAERDKKKAFTLRFTPIANLETPPPSVCACFLDCGRKPESTHKDTEQTLHRKAPARRWIQTQNLLSWGKSANREFIIIFLVYRPLWKCACEDGWLPCCTLNLLMGTDKALWSWTPRSRSPGFKKKTGKIPIILAGFYKMIFKYWKSII